MTVPVALLFLFLGSITANLFVIAWAAVRALAELQAVKRSLWEIEHKRLYR